MGINARTANGTGIGVRGGFLQLGGMAAQPIPFVVPAAFPVVRAISPIVPAIAAGAIAEALQAGALPRIAIPVSSLINGAMAAAVQVVIPRALNAVQVRPRIGGNPLQIIPSILLNQRRPNEETLSLARLEFNNGTFQEANPHGINKLRPEIISLMDFEPLYSGNTLNLNDCGLLFDVQYQARHLREQTFFQLMSEMQQSDESQELQALQNQFTSDFQKINNAADFYKNTIQTLETVKNGFDVKNIPSNNFDLRNFRTLKDFYQTFMLFPVTAFEKFSGTKVLMQLLFDVRSIAEGYSMNLLNLSDPDRQAGGEALLSPVSIDKTYNSRAGFSFTYDTIRSFNYAENASNSGFFTRFNTSLPQQPDDRIKLLTNMLSKELRVSRGLGRQGVKDNLRQKFNATTTDGSPFDNLLGGVGNTIFEPVTGPGSIASLTVLNNTNDSAVLPFETKYIDISTNTKKTYIPGSAFFVDSILNVENLGQFNMNPLRNYVSQYMETVDNTASIFSSIFDYGAEVSPLSSLNTLKLLLEPLAFGLQYLTSNNSREGFRLSVAEATVSAAFRLAANDARLKSLLFQYVLLQVVINSANSQTSFFASNIIEDLNRDIQNLDGVSVNNDNGLPNLYDKNQLNPYINNLGQSIQNRIVQLVNQRNLVGNGRIVQARSRAADPNTGILIVGYDVDTVFGIPAGLAQSQLINHFASVFHGLEVILGNESNSSLDASRRSRYNSLSVSTLALLAFEVFTQLINRFVRSDFQASGFGDNFPDMVVDTNFNARSYDSIKAIIAEPELPLPVVEPEPGTNSSSVNSIAFASTQRSPQNHAAMAVAHAVGQAARASDLLGSAPGGVRGGILANQSILGGQFATAGSRFTNAANMALRNVSLSVNPQELLDAHSIDQSLNFIAFKLFQEDFSLACAMHILLVIKRRLRNTLDLANNYFTQQTLTNLSSMNATSIQDIGQNLEPSQVRIMLRQRDDLVRQLTPNSQGLQFIPTSPTEQSTRAAILSMVAQGAFRETNNAAFQYRLLTVGIPAGFSKNLVERINGVNVTSTAFQKNKAFDVITVNVYKRSLEYPQLVFKPRKYIFDLSLFPNGYANLAIKSSDNFDRVLQKITLLDYQNFSNPTTVTIEQVVDSEKYDFISNSSLKRAMVENHVLSDLFASYIQFLTTMKLDESTFVNQNSKTYQQLSLGDGTDLTPQFSELARKYLVSKRAADTKNNPSLAPLPDLPINEMLQSPQIDQATKDTLKLLTFGNIAFKSENARAALLSPKVFERVFTIPLSVDDFEIDHEKTTASESGRDFFNKKFFQAKLDAKALVTGIYKFTARGSRDTVFEDYFATVELVE